MKGMLLTLTETIPNSIPVAIPTYLHEIGSKTVMQSDVSMLCCIYASSSTYETHVAQLS
jgi:hypothetical protein